MRADASRALLMQHEALALDARKPADPGADGHAGLQPRRLVHVGEPRVLDRLAGRIDPEDDEVVDLPLDLVVDALARIEAIFMVRRLHFAGDAAFLVAGVEMGDRPGAALARQDVL